MKLNIYPKVFLFLFLLAGLSGTSFSQTTITGTVNDEDGLALIGANVLVKGTSDGTITDLDGSFSLRTSQDFPLTLVISYTGYSEQEIAMTSNSPVSAVLAEGIVLGGDIIVTASRKREKVQEAPASVSILTARKLEGSPQTDPVRHLINVPGVQIQQQSAARINIEMRAASSIFSTSVFPIMDYRSLVGPGIGTFQSDAAGLVNIDMDRIEIVRGPGSALYGPGVTAGVVHFITKNPIDHPGTTVQVGYGELNTFISSIRHAGRNADKTFGYKINATYNKGDEFTLDGSEGTINASTGELETQISKFQTQVIRPAVTNGIVDLTKPGEVLLDKNDLDPDGDGNMMQNDWWNVAFNGTLEYRPQDDLSLILSGGYNEASAVFYNDLGEGLSQSSEVWTQFRVQKGGLFAQFFYVDNDGGTNEKPTLLYQTGNMTGVARKQIEGQIQYNFQTPSFFDADWTAGVDYRRAVSDTRNLTYGRNEDNDDYDIFGGYLQGKFALLDKLDLVVAGRYDRFDFFDDSFFSPRVAFVYKASPKHTFRASYNRAGSAPSALENYIDFPVNAPVPGVFDFWLAGQNQLQTFPDNPNIEFLNQSVVAAGISAATGIPIEDLLPIAEGLPDELPMGTLGVNGLPLALPYGVLSPDLIPLIVAGLMADPQTAPFAEGIGQFLATNAPGGSSGFFFGVNAFDGNKPLNQLIPTNKPVLITTNTYEIGYKGLIEDKLSISVDIYNTSRKGFSDFTQIAPLITLQGTDNLSSELGDAVASDVTDYLIGLGLPAASAAAIAAGVGGAYTQASDASGVGALLPNFYGTGTVETNRMPQGDGILHVAAGYRIFPDAELNYWGSDIGLEYYFNQDISAFFNYSWVSKTQFDATDLGEDADSPLTYSLNTPKNKFRVGLTYMPKSGFRGNISFQHDDGFFSNNGQFGGDVPQKNLVDAAIGYSFGNGLALDLTGQNILNNEYRAFNNMPLIGRRILAKATYTFGAEK